MRESGYTMTSRTGHKDAGDGSMFPKRARWIPSRPFTLGDVELVQKIENVDSVWVAEGPPHPAYEEFDYPEWQGDITNFWVEKSGLHISYFYTKAAPDNGGWFQAHPPMDRSPSEKDHVTRLDELL